MGPSWIMFISSLNDKLQSKIQTLPSNSLCFGGMGDIKKPKIEKSTDTYKQMSMSLDKINKFWVI